MIEVRNLCKTYGDKRGVEDISFRVETGEIVGLLGPNGAGKSTIMKMLSGYLCPTSGTAEIDGCDITQNPREAGKRIGFLPEIPPLYTDMAVEEYLTFLAQIKGVEKQARKAHVAELMALTQTGEVSRRLIRNLSKGYRQRVGLAGALAAYPDILILDEPTVGLDPKQITEVRALIEQLSTRHTILLSSHILSEIRMTCKRVIIINNGRLVRCDTIENLRREGLAGGLILEVMGEEQQAHAALAGLQGIEELSSLAQETQGICRLLVRPQPGSEVRPEIFYRLAEARLPIAGLHNTAGSLEEIFLRLTGEAQAASPAAPPPPEEDA